MINYQAPAEEMAHPSLAGESTEEKNEHIQEMIMQGLTDQQILDKHPELTQTMINTAKRALLDLNNGDTNNG